MELIVAIGLAKSRPLAARFSSAAADPRRVASTRYIERLIRFAQRSGQCSPKWLCRYEDFEALLLGAQTKGHSDSYNSGALHLKSSLHRCLESAKSEPALAYCSIERSCRIRRPRCVMKARRRCQRCRRRRAIAGGILPPCVDALWAKGTLYIELPGSSC